MLVESGSARFPLSNNDILLVGGVGFMASVKYVGMSEWVRLYIYRLRRLIG